MTEKPLHVQVAEALGWTDCQLEPSGLWVGRGHPWHGPVELKRYDTDWSATGPLIEKYELALGQTGMEDPKPTWVAWWPGSCDVDTCSVDAPADTPLLAACHLLLALKAAGKL